eukprot:4150572-Pleurochrysis_carterae.AAC.1
MLDARLHESASGASAQAFSLSLVPAAKAQPRTGPTPSTRSNHPLTPVLTTPVPTPAVLPRTRPPSSTLIARWRVPGPSARHSTTRGRPRQPRCRLRRSLAHAAAARTRLGWRSALRARGSAAT